MDSSLDFKSVCFVLEYILSLSPSHFHFSIVFRGAFMAVYFYVHENYKLVDLPWNSIWTWFMALLGVDFAYYWAHRFSHGKENSLLLNKYLNQDFDF